MIYRFEIEGEPKGKERARTVMQGGKVHSFTPKATKTYEAQVKAAFEECGGKMHETAAIKISVEAYYTIPKSKTGAARERVIVEDRPQKKPDIDNVVKIICDGLNGVAYKDDSQVVEISAAKHWATDDKPCVLVWVHAIDARWEQLE